jgi:hypothetical protein
MEDWMGARSPTETERPEAEGCVTTRERIRLQRCFI